MTGPSSSGWLSRHDHRKKTQTSSSPLRAIFKRTELCFVLSCLLPITMDRPSVDWISMSALTPGRQPSSWMLANPFHAWILISSSSPASNCRLFLLAFCLNTLLPSSQHSGLWLAPFLILETWLSITWHVLQDYMWPREQVGWTVVWEPSRKEAHLTSHWLSNAWQRENLSSASRVGGEEADPQLRSGLCGKEDFTTSFWLLWECYLHQGASGSSELNICLVGKCLPFFFEVWHPSCHWKPLCQDSMTFLES